MAADPVRRRPLRPALALALLASGLLAFTEAPVHAATGSPPTVAVGADQIVARGDTAFLPGSVSDDGLPVASAVTASWTKVSGPGAVQFGNPEEAHTSATFSASGSYLLRLTASDGGGRSTADLTVTVVEQPSTVVRVPQDHATIQAALDAAPAHALVLVSPGTYPESVTIRRPLTLASTWYTTGDPARIDQTVIQGLDANQENIAIATAAPADTRLVGFTVTGGKDGIKVRGAGVVEHNHFTGLGTDAVEVTPGGAALVQHNTIDANGDDGVDLGSSSAVVVDNLVRDNGGDGVETRTRNKTSPIDEVILRGNRFLGNDDNGLQVIDDDTVATSPAQSATLFTIDRNVIAGNAQAGLGLMDNGETTEDYRGASLVERITVVNNTFDANTYGITGGDNLVAVNNVFARHPQTALKNVDGASRAAYNLFFGNGTRDTSSTLDTATSFSGDPMLDSSWSPRPGSPVIDRGTASYALPTGEAVARVLAYQGNAPDLGAVESAESADPTDPPPDDPPPAQEGGHTVDLFRGASTRVAGSQVRLTGSVTDTGSGAAVGGEPVTVRAFRAPDGHAVTLGTVTTGSDGRFVVVDTPRVTTRYLALTAAGRSAKVTVRVRPRLTGHLTRSVLHRGGRTTLQGVVAPSDRGQVVRLQRRSDGDWATRARMQLPGGAEVGYRFVIRPRTTGRFAFRVVADAYHGRDAAATATLVLRVRR